MATPQEDFAKFLPQIKALSADQVREPVSKVTNKMVDCTNLHFWMQPDLESFKSINFPLEKYAIPLPEMVNAMRYVQADWLNTRGVRSPEEQEWMDMQETLFDFRDKILADFHYFYRDNDQVSSRLSEISKGNTMGEFSGVLSEISDLGKKFPAELNAANFDMTLLDQAAEYSRKIMELSAKATVQRLLDDPKKDLRDRMFTLLDNAHHEIVEAGKYLFKNNPTRLEGYAKSFIRSSKRVAKPKAADQVAS